MTVTPKAALRRQALAGRAASANQTAARAAQQHLSTLLAQWAAVDNIPCLAGYWPIKDELDPRPVMANWPGALCLPVVVERDAPLIFRRYRMGDALDHGAFGTAHPPETAANVVPRLVIVPLAGFDRSLNRLGYGGGFYDRTLALLRESGPVTAIGLGFAGQEVAPIPTEPTDIALDLIVTENEILRPLAKGQKHKI